MGWSLCVYPAIFIFGWFGNYTNWFAGVLDREGNARKVVNCSCVVVKDWGEESQERSILLNYFQTEQ
jgi:hypothetical protein